MIPPSRIATTGRQKASTNAGNTSNLINSIHPSAPLAAGAVTVGRHAAWRRDAATARSSGPRPSGLRPAAPGPRSGPPLRPAALPVPLGPPPPSRPCASVHGGPAPPPPPPQPLFQQQPRPTRPTARPLEVVSCRHRLPQCCSR